MRDAPPLTKLPGPMFKTPMAYEKGTQYEDLSHVFYYPASVFTLVSNEHISKVAKRLVHFTHKPNIKQQLIWAGHLSELGANGF